MKTVIVEDDFIVADHLKLMLGKFDVEVLGIVDNYDEALQYLDKGVELYFLDIRIDGPKTGIDIGNELQKKSINFVYVTANNEVPTLKRAVKTKPMAYITKPYKESDILAVLEIAKSKKEEMITVNSKFGKKMLPLKSVLYFASDGSYINVVTKEDTFTERNSLNHLEALYQNNFARIHRSYLVNLSHIEEYNSKSVFINNESLPISRSYRKELVKKLEKAAT